MRGLPARRIASTALCASLLVGIAGPAAIAADSAGERHHAASRAPVPGADDALAQLNALGDLGSVLAPVVDLLGKALQDGRLTPEEAQKIADAVKTAIAKITAAVPTAPPTTPLSSTTRGGDAKGRAPSAKDLTGDALAALQKAVDGLVAAAASGDATQVLPAVTAVVTGLVNLVAATLQDDGLPAPDLPVSTPPTPTPPTPTATVG
ncbi:hypothetical protein ACIPSA_05000 [Streptomyces sp. NPDC086549]|uniref:hypothetical protein n=1 Tax=Streptomyces sp. NPDC086549 TaxID=3365752 RepID=UPI003814750F